MAKKSNKDKSAESVSEPEVVVADETSEPEEISEVDPAELEVLPADVEIAALPVEDASELATESEAAVRDLVPYDGLQAYLREISQVPILSREQEYALALRYKEQHDISAAYDLVRANLRLVVLIAKEYQRAVRSILDLIQEGNIGLMEAVKKFDPYRGVRFPSYAVWWIRAYIVRYVIANWRLVKIGTTQAQRRLFFNLRKEQEKLEREGFFPGPKLLAEKLDVKESEIIEMQQRLDGPDVSVDAPLEDNPDSTLLSILPSNNISAEDFVSKKQFQALLTAALDEFRNTLNEKEKAIFEQRLLGEEKATLQDLAEKFSLSRERIRQLESRIEKKLKAFLLERIGPEIMGERSEFGGD